MLLHVCVCVRVCLHVCMLSKCLHSHVTTCLDLHQWASGVQHKHPGWVADIVNVLTPLGVRLTSQS